MIKEYNNPFGVFDYKDVRLVPRECVVNSRSEVDVSVVFGSQKFKLPVIPANMSTVVDEQTCEWLAQEGYFYVMHRFDVDPVEFTQRFHEKGLYASVSLGIKQADYDHIERFRKLNIDPDYVTVDVAHGDSQKVFEIVKKIRDTLPDTFIIAGNVATKEGALRLASWGADAVKTGVGPGLACTTAPNTGFGSRDWQLSALANVAEALNEKFPEVVVVADGGIREYGDFAKSVAFGAKMVMVGGLFAGHDENPGELIEDENGDLKKAFFGSASEHQKGEHKHVEGKKLFVPYRGSLKDTLRIVKENLQSSVSYAGGTKLKDLREVEYVLLNKH